MSWAWKDMTTGEIRPPMADSAEQLFSISGFIATKDNVTKPVGKWLAVLVVERDGKWVEAPAAPDHERIWGLLVQAASSS